MNFILDISQIDYMNFIFLEKKKNIIVDGYFTKIIYSDSFIRLNNIYLNIPIQFQYIDKTIFKNNIFFNYSQNNTLIKNISNLEEELIESYKKEFNVKKNSVLSLNNQMKTGKIKIYKEYSNDSNENRRLSSSSLSEAHSSNSDCRRSGVVDGTETRNSGVEDGRVCRNNDISSIPFRLKPNTSIILKISGLWETNIEIGIAFKFIEMYNIKNDVCRRGGVAEGTEALNS